MTEVSSIRTRSHYDALPPHDSTYMSRPTLSSTMSAFALELEQALVASGHGPLAEGVAALRIVDRCRCGDHNCATFYTDTPPDGPFGPGHRCVQVDVRRGMVILDVVHGEIRCVEVLDRQDVRQSLDEAFP